MISNVRIVLSLDLDNSKILVSVSEMQQWCFLGMRTKRASSPRGPAHQKHNAGTIVRHDRRRRRRHSFLPQHRTVETDAAAQRPGHRTRVEACGFGSRCPHGCGLQRPAAAAARDTARPTYAPACSTQTPSISADIQLVWGNGICNGYSVTTANDQWRPWGRSRLPSANGVNASMPAHDHHTGRFSLQQQHERKQPSQWCAQQLKVQLH